MKLCCPMSEMREERIADSGYRNSELIDLWLVSGFFFFFIIDNARLAWIWRSFLCRLNCKNSKKSCCNV